MPFGRDGFCLGRFTNSAGISTNTSRCACRLFGYIANVPSMLSRGLKSQSLGEPTNVAFLGLRTIFAAGGGSAGPVIHPLMAKRVDGTCCGYFTP